MDPLVPAFVAVLLAMATDRPPLLAAILADRFGTAATVAGTIAAQATGFALAAVAGTLVAPHLTPNARALLLALALLSAGGSALFAARIKDRLDGWHLPGIIVAALGMAVLALGDRSQFLIFAVTARTPDALLAAIGGILAATVVTTVAATMGERDWTRLPLRFVRPLVATLLLLAGIVTGLSALRLV
jgi:putative Ca2+/H+ antiporter (TMEM165/GDT1 family)